MSTAAAQKTSTSLISTLRLGAGSLRELRIHLWQRSPASQGVREFIENDYVELKRANQSFPILVRECSGITPRIWARYDFGVETSVSLENAPRGRVAEVVRQLAASKSPQSNAEKQQ